MTCNYMNACSGHGFCSVSNGECQCDKGWAGADCSKQVQLLTSFYSKKEILQGARWTYFSYEESLYYNERYEFTLESELPMDIYLTQGSIRDNDPNEFNYDVAFKQQKFVRITSDMFSASPKFAVAMLINGIDYYNNATNLSTFKASFKIYDIKTGQAVSRVAHSDIAH